MITKEPKNPQTLTEPLIFTKSARAAFEHLLNSIDFSENKQLLIPAYIGFSKIEGSGVFDPISSTKTPYSFYPINPDLSLDFNVVSSMVASGHFKMLLVIHYFGFPQADIFRLKELCKTHSVLLVEDCAHTLNSEIQGCKLGTIGDFSIASIHKSIATPNGGYLRNNTDTISIPSLPSELAISLPTLEQLQKSNLIQIAETRKNNYRYLNARLTGSGLIQPLHTSLPEGCVPLNFPVIIKNGLREKLYFYLIKHQAPVIALYHTMIKDLPRSEFPLSFDIANSILNFPVHQDITLKDLDFLILQIHNGLKAITQSE